MSDLCYFGCWLMGGVERSDDCWLTVVAEA